MFEQKEETLENELSPQAVPLRGKPAPAKGSSSGEKPAKKTPSKAAIRQTLEDWDHVT